MRDDLTVKIVADGPQGAGKTLLLHKLVDFLQREGYRASPVDMRNDKHEFCVALNDSDRVRLGNV